MAGGVGNDVYEVTSVGEVVTELAGAGNDTVWTSLASYTLDANVENLFFGGSGNFVGVGNVLANMLVGGAGNDVLIGAQVSTRWPAVSATMSTKSPPLGMW